MIKPPDIAVLAGAREAVLLKKIESLEAILAALIEAGENLICDLEWANGSMDPLAWCDAAMEEWQKQIANAKKAIGGE